MSIPRRIVALASASVIALPAAAAPFAYVTNEGSASVSIIDVATDRVVETFAAGRKPRGLAISPDGATLYLSDQPSGASARGGHARGRAALGRGDPLRPTARRSSAASRP